MEDKMFLASLATVSIVLGFLVAFLLDPSLGILTTLLLGQPAWFIGALYLGVKYDEVVGANGAFWYETLGCNNNKNNKK